MAGNHRASGVPYCIYTPYGEDTRSSNKADENCNNLNKNAFIWVFYLITCAYLYMSAL